MRRPPARPRRWAGGAARSAADGARSAADGARAAARAARRTATDGAASGARRLDRVATLVAAGLPPPRAWSLVGGLPVTDDPAWQDVAVVLRVAERTGAPSAEALRALARALRRSAASDRAVRVALAGPRTSARVVLALPVLGLALASTWGAGAVTVLVGSPLGWACSAVAAGLVAVGRRWTARLVRAATPDGHVAGVLLDAWAVAVSGGGSWTDAGAAVEEAFDAVARSAVGAGAAGRGAVGRGVVGSGAAGVGVGGGAACRGVGGFPVPAVSTDRAEVERARLAEVLVLARRAGVPAAALLRAAAEDVRDDAAGAALAAAERLAVRLVLPLGVCVLPAFVLVGVVPVVVGVLSSTVVGTP
ncbi:MULTISPECIES: type II secretion system F family protein [unclassified Curtobacterium]|uniref:type II secretion system F family protein n=1 Tax=unclassified Curtobacterium TaxID=257496 RepID=UPI0009FD1D0B|nr:MULTISPECIES: type II secretion system F family protein [unclassified Curtobacterium]